MNDPLPLHAGAQLRPMTPEDLAAVVRVENATQVTPWSEGVFADCLKADYDCRVIEREGEVVGFSIVSRVLDEAHLLNIAVAPKCQRLGLAWATLKLLCDDLRARDTGLLYLEVRESNVGARKLYERFGFLETGLRKDYYRTASGRENAILMLLGLRADHK